MSVIARATVTLAAVSDGVGVSAVTAYYTAGTSATEKPSSPSTAEWSTSPPDIGDEEYLWMAYLITYTSGTAAWTEPCCLSDASTREAMLEVKETSAKVYELAESVLIAAVETDSVWYTKNYTITATSCGLPADEGYAATDYSGKYYLDQATGYVYLSDGHTWEFVEALKSTTETLEGNIETSAGEVRAYVDDAVDEISSTTSASLVLEIMEAEDGTKYGVISANADRILLYGDQIEIVTGDFTLSDGNATFSGTLEAASGTFTGELIAASGTFAGELQAASGTFEGELVAASGTFETITGGVLQSSNYVSGESGLCIDITNGTIDCASLTAEIGDGLLLKVSETYATLEDYKTLESLMDDTVVDVQVYFAISDSADKYPDLEIAEGKASYAGIARAGLWLAGYYGWTTEMPVYDDGDYVWMCHLVTYLSGNTAWTEPTLIVDGSLTSDVLTLKKTTATIQIQADSILQTVTETNATWYTGDYTVALSGYGAPDDAGYTTSSYKGLYYLDQSTGYLYLSDGSEWKQAAELKSTTETLEGLIDTSAGNVKLYVDTYYTTGNDVSDIISASIVLSITELEDGTKYGSLSGNADYIELIGDDIVIHTDDFILENGNATFSGELSAATGSFSGALDAATGTYEGELVAASGTFGTITGGILMSGNYVENESGLYIDLNNGTINCASLTTEVNSNISLIAKASAVYYGTCSTGAGVPYKTVTCDDFDEDCLVVGATIRVTFVYKNSAYPVVLNVNGTGNVEVLTDGASWKSGSSDNWEAGATVVFQYDGTSWNLVETGSYQYAQARFVLEVATDGDGKSYGTLSGIADYVKFTAGEFVVDANNFSIDSDGNGTIGSWTMGETSLYNGTESIESWEAGAYVGTDGIRYVSEEDGAYAFVQLDKTGISLYDNTGYTSTSGSHHYGVDISNNSISMGFHTLDEEMEADFHGGGICIGKVGSYSMPRFTVYGRAAAERLTIAPFSDTDNINAGANGYIKTDLMTTIDNDLTVTGEINLEEKLTINGTSLKALQHGTTDALTVTSSGQTTTTVTFDKEFPETPTVVVTATGGYFDLFATIVSVSTTKCVIALYNTGSSSRSSMKISWMAMC